MSRLVTFGCSYTYGEGLPDCWDDKIGALSKPSKLAWPNWLGKKLDLTVNNYSIPAASNKRIWYEVLGKEIKSSDVVIILWSHFDRFCIFDDNKSIRRLLPSDTKYKKRFTRIYYQDYWSRTDSVIDSFNRINYTDFYLKSKNIKVYHFTAEMDYDYEEPFWNQVKLCSLPICTKPIDFALDKSHPGIETQRKISEIIFKKMEH